LKWGLDGGKRGEKRKVVEKKIIWASEEVHGMAYSAFEISTNVIAYQQAQNNRPV